MIKEKYSESIKETSINVVQSSFESLRKKNITKTGLRIYKEGMLGISGALGDYDEKELEKKALDNLTVPYDYEVSSNKKITEDYSKHIMTDEEFVQEVEAILEVCRRDFSDFGLYNKFKIVNEETSLKNDKGLELLMRDSYLSIDLLFNDKSIAGLEGFFWEVQSRDYSRENLLKEFDMLCRAYRNKLTLPKEGKMPVVFIDMDSMPLMKFHTDLNGLWVGSGTSIFSKDMGSKRFSYDFTLYATRNPQDGIHTFFDGEGVINENYRYTLIEDGVIKAPYTDKRTASRFNLPLTGSAGCTYDSAPRLDVPSLKIRESGKTVKELLGGEKGILVVTASGGDFTPEGNFATPVQVPILFDGENMLGMLPNLQISGSVYDMFGGGFRGVSTDYINPTQKFKAMVMEMNVTRL